MDVKNTADQIADILWDLLTDDRSQTVQHFSQDPNGFMAAQGHVGVTPDDFERAIDRLADRMGPDHLAQVAPIRSVVQSMPAAQTMAPVAPLHQVSIVQHAAAPQVVRHVNEQRVTHVQENVTQENRQFVTNNQTTNHFVREGDVVTDNRTITQIEAAGDVEFDQRIENHTVTVVKGGVAVEGDVEDSVINTGKNSGVIAGDDVDLEDSIVGNGNTQVNDSTVGALSGRGNATNLSGHNVNAGSGDLVDVEAEGDAQVATGNGNQLTDDVDLDLRDVDGPVDVAIGDGNRQQAVEDNSAKVEESFNEDHSTDDSHNTTTQDSLNTVTEDNDSRSTSYDDSLNTVTEDNDSRSTTTTYDDSLKAATEDNDSRSTTTTAYDDSRNGHVENDGSVGFDWETHDAQSSTYEGNDQLHTGLDAQDDELTAWGHDDALEDDFDDDGI